MQCTPEAPSLWSCATGRCLARRRTAKTSSDYKPWDALEQVLDRLEQMLRCMAASLKRRNRSKLEGDRDAGSGARTTKSQCVICLEDFQQEDMISFQIAGPKSGPVTRGAAGRMRCQHLSCSGCVQGYASARIASRKFPLSCPGGAGCPAVLPPATAAALLKDSPLKLKALKSLEAEHAIEPSQRMYCPYKDCSAVMRRSRERSSCKQCRREFCGTCMVAGWHTVHQSKAWDLAEAVEEQGYTCHAFQQLPLHQRSPEDAQMLRLVKTSGWKQCPGCGLVIERVVGCDHMTCRCGTSFCYRCGRRNTAHEGYCGH